MEALTYRNSSSFSSSEQHNKVLVGKLHFPDVLITCHVHISIVISPSDTVKKEIHHFIYLFICNFALRSYIQTQH